MIYIITGHYGSGKTEFAIELAKRLKNATIVDLDIVNPYFRTKDAEAMLKEQGVKVIASEFANTNVDIPTLPADIIGALQTAENVVLDVGGDDDGAIALGQYHSYFKEKEYEMLFVINSKRPSTANVEDTVALMRNIELVSRTKITGIVSNTNIKSETTVNIVLEGLSLAEEVSKETDVPVVAVSARCDIADIIKEKAEIEIPVISLNLNLTLPWEV